MEGRRRPITPRRLARMRATLARRQPDLAVVVEDIHDPHNVSAMLRSCDAVGVGSVHLVYTREPFPDISSGIAASAHRWLDIIRHDSIESCYAALRACGCRIYATALAGEAHELYDLDLTLPTAVVFGNERRGVSEAALAAADGVMYIPMMGMVESLNVSVATAVTLYEAFRQRRAAGRYDRPQLTGAEIEARLRRWLEREGRDTTALDQLLDVAAPKAEDTRPRGIR